MVHRSLFLIVAGTAVSLAGAASLGAQARERVAFVSVVERATGAPKTDLTASDIVIREDSVTREVLRVTRATGAMPIAVLVDTSEAAEAAIPDMRAALTAFVAALGDTGPVSLIGFGERPTLITDYTTNPATLAAGIGRVFSRPLSGATLLEGVFETATGLARRESERAAIVVLSANGPEMSTLHHLRVAERLQDSGASFHTVVLSPPGRLSLSDTARQRDLLLDRGVRITGGLRRDVLASMAFTAAMTDLARLLTHQFRVVYARPQTLIPPDSFAVTATSPGLTAYGGVARGQPK
jgi:hypothetical protein